MYKKLHFSLEMASLSGPNSEYGVLQSFGGLRQPTPWPACTAAAVSMPTCLVVSIPTCLLRGSPQLRPLDDQSMGISGRGPLGEEDTFGKENNTFHSALSAESVLREWVSHRCLSEQSEQFSCCQSHLPRRPDLWQIYKLRGNSFLFYGNWEFVHIFS